ncbi:MAG: hypothetical protein Q6362_008445 [Candidatus Wukongarchaeota archaeon]|nr:hypothetical protein [Candidatus Wukongarchaeota archaeon]
MLWLKRHVEEYEKKYGKIKAQKPEEGGEPGYIT